MRKQIIALVGLMSLSSIIMFKKDKLFLYIKYYADLLNPYSNLIQVGVTAVLVIVTWLHIREIENERRFRLKREHADELKKRVIEPWITELESIKIPDKPGYKCLPKKIISSTHSRVYEGDDLEIEKKEDILFEDLRNHIPNIMVTI